MRNESTIFHNKQVEIHLCSWKEYLESWNDADIGFVWYEKYLGIKARAFTTKRWDPSITSSKGLRGDWRYHIWIFAGASDLEGLLAHELGHVYGLNHSAFFSPVTMNQTGLLRWRDPEDLRPAAVSLLRSWRM